MIGWILPRPILSAVLALVWVLLANEVSVGSVALGVVLGVVIAKCATPFWPVRPVVRSKRAVAPYLGIVMKDILVSNIDVAKLVLFRRGDTMRSQFVTVPLDIRSPEAIAVLAGTITLTPGTLTADVSADGRFLLVHCLETDDPAGVVASIKERYESRLKEIFE
jgi:multicomponent K+:H+ antiporter subunit E